MKLELRPSLRQVLAPQLIQSLKMLQMPLLKLEQKLRMELVANPLLEEIEELEETPEESTTEEENSDEVDWDEYLFDNEEGYKVREYRETEESRFEGTAASTKSLYDHLHEQLSYLKL